MAAATAPGDGTTVEGLEEVRRRRRALRRWFLRAGRDLPWRATRDPWAILVAEVMLQQTQVARVEQRWAPFLDEFPDPATTAAAGRAAVVRAWAGLGYHRRAAALHGCAVAVTERHGGALPTERGALEALPGIGPYTSRAVLAFAFEQDVAVVDTNVGRVVARWVGEPLTAGRAQAVADVHVPRGGGWWWNQALLDLGATVCSRRGPDCARCPVRRRCAWGAAGAAGADPADGSAGVGVRQSRFEGSDRQGRGRLLAALRAGSLPDEPQAVAVAAGWPDDASRAQRALAGLIADGLVERAAGALRLAG